MSVQKSEMSFSSFLIEWVPNFFSQFSDESFEVQSITVVGFIDLCDSSVNDFVFLIQAKSCGGQKQISHLSPSLPRVSIEGEHVNYSGLDKE